jgi:RHS repeat-associated protein
MRLSLCALAMYALLFGPLQVLAQTPKPTISWISDTSGFWDISSNWKDSTGAARVPNANDDVLIDRGSVRPVISIRSSQSVRSIAGTAPVVITAGAVFAVAAASQLDGGLTLDNGGLVVSGSLAIAGDSGWKAGAIWGNGVLTNTGTLTLTATDTKFLGSSLNNSGAIVHQGGVVEFDLQLGSIFFVGTLNNTGLYDIQADVTFSRTVFGNMFTNSGTIRKSAGNGTASINIPFTNNGGTLDSESGTLALTGGSSGSVTHNGGTFSAGVNDNPVAVLQLAGSESWSGTFTGSGKGTVQMQGFIFTASGSGATLNFPPGLLQWADGILDGATAGWHNTGSLTLIGPAGARTYIRNRFDNTGTFIISGFTGMHIDGCGTFTNLPGALFDFQGDGAIFDTSLCPGSHQLINQGTVRKSAGIQSNIEVSGFNNTATGTIDVRLGTLALLNSQNTGGVFTVAAGATLDLTEGAGNPQTSCSTTYSGSYTGSGQGTVLLAGCGLVVGQAGAQFNFPPGLFQWTGGIITGGANGLTNAGTITLSGSGTKYLGGTLNNSGTIAHQAGPLQMDSANCACVGTLNNSGLYDMQADVTISRQFLDSDIINNTGTFRKSAGTGAASIVAPFNNAGTLEARSGSLTVFTTQIDRNLQTGNTLTGGTWHVFSNATLKFTNPLLTLADTVAINNAVVILDGAGASFPGVAPLNTNSATLSLINGSTFTTSGGLNNLGTVTLGASTQLNVAGTYSQGSSASLTIQIAGRPQTGQFGHFSSTGAASLGGTFNGTLATGFGLTSGDSYTVMTFPSHTGSFSTIGGSNLGLHADLSSTALTLTAMGSQSDLSTTSVAIVTPTAKPGQPVTVNFTVKNLGGVAATGNWDDSVYLSPSSFIEPSSVFLGKVHHTGDIASQSSYDGTLTAPLPPLLSGGYRVLVIADSGGVVPDSNRDNNTGVSTGTIAVLIPLLSVGAPISDKIINGQDLYYHLVLSPGADITLSASYAVAQQAELYVRFAALPSRITFDLSTLNDLSNPNPKLSINSSQGGDYYVLLHGLTAAGAGQAFTLALTAAQFQITSIYPEAALNSGPQTIFLAGVQFTPTTTVSLVAANGTVFPASSVSFTDSTKISATFDLSKVPLGSYTVRAISGNQTAISSTLFQVTDIVVGNFASSVILSPPAVPVGSPIGVSITINGVGDSLTPVPLVQVDASGVAAGQEHQQLVDPALPLFFRGHLQFGLGYDPEPHAAGAVSNFNLSLISLIQPIDWDSQKDSLRPPEIPADAWDAIWANLRPRLGGIVGDFYALLGKDAGALATVGIKTNRINRLFRFEIAMANNQLPVWTTSSALDAAFPAPGMPLQFARTFLGSSIAGRYRLGRLGRGWVDSLDISAVTDTVTKRVTIQQGPLKRIFARNQDGSYTATPGDFGALTQPGGIYQLREKTGLVTVFRTDGWLDYIQDTNNNRLTAGYSNGRLTTLTHSDGSVLTIAYNGQGRVQQITDPVGRTATCAYDVSGDHLLTVTTSAGTVSYSYTTETTGPRAFALASITTPAGTHRFFEYDTQGRLKLVQRDGGAEALKYSYDVTSVRITDAKDRPFTMFYDDSGRVVATIDALGRAQVSQFDDSGNLASVVPCARFEVPCRPEDQLNNPTDLSYDPQGNLTGSVDPLGATETSAFDPTFSQLTLATDALGQKIIFGIDANGNSISATYADGTSNQRGYDAQGNPIRFVDRNGKVTLNTYDKLGFLKGTQLSDGSQIAYMYDSHGNLASVTDAQGTITMYYDTADRLINITYPKGRSLSYSYDGGGRLRQIMDQSGFTINYNYDQPGRLSSVTDAKGALITSYTYDAAGRITRIDKGNGTYTTFDYDNNARLEHLVNFAPGNTVNSRFDYTYDDLGRRNSATTLEGKTTFGYDADSRLTSVTLPNGRAIIYVYDAAGNRIGVSDNGTATAYTANNLNEYTSIGSTSQSYDSAGNLRSSGGSSYAYDSLNRLTGVNAASGSDTYEYDPLGHRVAVTHNGQRTDFLIDLAGNPVAEYNAAGQLLAHYVYGSALTSRVDPSGFPAYYDFDALGSAAGLTGLTGAYINRYSYLPFGESLSATESIPNRFRYVGAYGVLDDQNGLYYMRARFYSPAEGRFTQADPIGLAGGSNLYVYAGNNPVTLADPSGLQGPVDPFGATVLHPNVSPLAYDLAPGQSPFAYEVPPPGQSPLAFEVPPPGVSPLAYEGQLPGATPIGGVGGVSQAQAQAAREWALNKIAADESARLASAARAAAFRRFLGYLGIGLELAAYAKGTYDFFHPLFTGGILPCFPVPALGTCFNIPFITASPAGHSQTIQRDRNGIDPNFISGPGGFGPNNFVIGSATLPYYIGFENLPTAGGPAAQVIVTDAIDPNLDVSSFELGDFGFGNIDINVPPGLRSYKTRVDARTSRGLFVDVSAQLTGNVVTWTFTSIDPVTGQPPTSFQAGFLPPDRNPPEGQGFVNYFVRPRSGLASGTLVKAQASIVFDTNAAVATNIYVNALDTGKPTSRVNALPTTEASTTFTVSWSGTDTGGPGIASYDIFVSTDGGPFQPLSTNTSATSTSFTGKAGHTFGFYSIARDQLGNLEGPKSAADTTTTINNAAPLIQCTGCYFLVDGIRATLAFNVSVLGSTSTFTYNYRTATQTVQFTSITTTAISVNGNTATFSGQGTMNGQNGYNFAVTATDGGGPGSGLDSVSIAITGPNNFSHSKSGTIVGGDIIVKP